MSKPVIFSGIQPTGNLHIGNYLGAVKNWVELQNSGEYDCYFAVMDLHSLIGNMNADDRHDQIIRTVAELIAAGIDPDKCTFFVQSHVPQHSELAWMFNCVTPIAELERMTQFKDKSARQDKNINAGLLTYPILQAADILLYHGTHIPVGKDQVQHVELTRDIARWFNNRYTQDYFPEAESLLTEIPSVKSLLDPLSKMSKSKGEGHVIELADEPKVLEKKLKKAVTASEGGEGAPGVQNLLLLLKTFGQEADYQSFLQAEMDGSIRYGDLKHAVALAVSEYFASFRERRKELMDNHNEIADILIQGAEKASAKAEETMEAVRKLVGIR